MPRWLCVTIRLATFIAASIILHWATVLLYSDKCWVTVRYTLLCQMLFGNNFFITSYFDMRLIMLDVLYVLMKQNFSWMRKKIWISPIDLHCKNLPLLATYMTLPKVSDFYNGKFVIFCQIHMKFCFWVHKKHRPI